MFVEFDFGFALSFNIGHESGKYCCGFTFDFERENRSEPNVVIYKTYIVPIVI